MALVGADAGNPPASSVSIPVLHPDTSTPQPGSNTFLLLGEPPYSPPNRGMRQKRVVGNSTVVCNCCIFPKYSATSLILAVAVLFPVVVFLTTVSSSMVSFIVVLFLTCGMLLMLFLSISIDPGIIPPLPYDPARREEKVVVNNVEVICKVCTTCNIVRPPRSGHCFHCDYCVEEFDHHCGVLGSCVAKRTFRFFAGFMYFASAVAAYIFICSCIRLSQMNISSAVHTDSGRWEVVAAIGCAFYTGVGGCFAFGIGATYISLACSNSSQKEQLAQQRILSHVSPYRNPYDQGRCRNFFLRFFGPLGESLLTKNNLHSVVNNT